MLPRIHQWDGVGVVRFEELLAFVFHRPFLSEKAVYLQIVFLLLIGYDTLKLLLDCSSDLRR